MSIPCKFERSILSYDEHEIILRSHHPEIYDASPDDLRALRQRLREMRDKERTLARGKRREARGKGPSRGESFPGTAEHPLRRKQVFAAALKRVSKEIGRAFAVFMFVLWFWLLIIVIGDLFRRRDISGWVKAIWVIALIVFSYLGIFAYMITQSRGMAERSSQQAQQSRDELRRVVGFSAADEIEKLDRLKKSGSITDQEFARLRAKLVA